MPTIDCNKLMDTRISTIDKIQGRYIISFVDNSDIILPSYGFDTVVDLAKSNVVRSRCKPENIPILEENVKKLEPYRDIDSCCVII